MMNYKITAMVKGEKETEEYPSSFSRHQAKTEFRLLYPTASRMVVDEVRQKKEEEEKVQVGKVEGAKKSANRLQLDLEVRARREQAVPYYR